MGDSLFYTHIVEKLRLFDDVRFLHNIFLVNMYPV